MTTKTYIDTVTLVDAASLNDMDTAAYAYLTSPAGTNTITATGAANLTYAAGLLVRVIPAATNTGATTINITPSGSSALGAKNVYFNGAACAGGEIRQSQPCILIYDGTQFNLVGPFCGGTIAGPFTATGNVALGDNAADTFRVTSDALTVVGGGSGADNYLQVYNRNNTSGSNGGLIAYVAGTAAGDPYAQFQVAGVTTWTMGIDNSDSDKFKISASSALGTSDVLAVEPGGNFGMYDATTGTSVLNTSHSHATGPLGIAIIFTGGAPNDTTQWFLRGSDTGASRAFIYSNGTFGSATNTYGAIVSEREFKQDITKAGSQWEDVKAIAALTSKFRFKTEPDAHLQMGWIVDEIELVSPGLITESRELVPVEVKDEEGNVVTEQQPIGPVRKGLKTSIIYMKAVKALGEAMERIEVLEARLAAAGIK